MRQSLGRRPRRRTEDAARKGVGPGAASVLIKLRDMVGQLGQARQHQGSQRGGVGGIHFHWEAQGIDEVPRTPFGRTSTTHVSHYCARSRTKSGVTNRACAKPPRGGGTCMERTRCCPPHKTAMTRVLAAAGAASAVLGLCTWPRSAFHAARHSATTAENPCFGSGHCALERRNATGAGRGWLTQLP